MKVRVITSFNDKTEGFINRPINEVFECSESRAKDLQIALFQKDEMNKVRILGKAVGFYSNVL
ncbi:hypothetical protein [Ruminococcus sp.]|uniref:hypothetical protein n=1 Tax=Ruminococcus sp. TaxID=41978 RepID=UPI003AAED3C1